MRLRSADGSQNDPTGMPSRASVIDEHRACEPRHRLVRHRLAILTAVLKKATQCRWPRLRKPLAQVLSSKPPYPQWAACSWFDDLVHPQSVTHTLLS